jgi:hypothetical protein
VIRAEGIRAEEQGSRGGKGEQISRIKMQNYNAKIKKGGFPVRKWQIGRKKGKQKSKCKYRKASCGRQKCRLKFKNWIDMAG